MQRPQTVSILTTVSSVLSPEFKKGEDASNGISKNSG